MRLAGTLLFVLLSLLSSQASAASTCPSPRAVSIVAGGEYYEDYTNAPCSQFGLTGTLVAPLYGTLEDSNATNAVRYRNTNLSATSDTFTVRDDVGQPIVYNVTITSAIVLAPSVVPNATVAQTYSTTTLTATGGATPYTYAISAGALPAGLSLSSGGVLSGTPTAGGTFNFTVRATDSSTGRPWRARLLADGGGANHHHRADDPAGDDSRRRLQPEHHRQPAARHRTAMPSRPAACPRA